MLWGSSLLLTIMKHSYTIQRLAFTAIYLLTVVSAYSQQDTSLQEAPVRQYYTQRMRYLEEQTDTATLNRRNEIERFVSTAQYTTITHQVTIPMVFHVLYNPSVGAADEDQVAAQLETLNRDFASSDFQAKRSKFATDKFTDVVSSTDINFCVPLKAPNGKRTSGVNFIATDTLVWHATNSMKSSRTGGYDPWDPSQFLNVWVVNLEDSMTGWAQLPGGPSSTDGIVIDRRYFGSGGTALYPYDQGKTLTHLVANYLNLYDLWDEYVRCGDDYVGDTPVHNSPNYACYREENHVSLCYDEPREMVMNFMDNTPDDCMYLFTQGQRIRMQATLAEGGPRYTLVSTPVKCGKPPHGSSAATAGLTTTDSGLSDEYNRQDNADTSPYVEVSPNPAIDQATLSIDVIQASKAQVSVYNSLGQLVLHEEMNFPSDGIFQNDFPISEWPSGTYYVHVQVDGYVVNQKLIVQRTLNPSYVPRSK